MRRGGGGGVKGGGEEGLSGIQTSVEKLDVKVRAEIEAVSSKTVLQEIDINTACLFLLRRPGSGLRSRLTVAGSLWKTFSTLQSGAEKS